MNLTTYTSSVIGTSTPWKADISEHGVLWLLQEDNFDGGILAVNLETNEVKTIRPLPSSTVHNLTIDYNDDVWIATAEGPAIFPNASYPFDGQSPILPIFENGTLFEGERIYSIAVDGGNRIWISTSTGIYLFNSSITELVRRFTITNSPLPSTRVSQFAYNEQNGEMFILTEKGMMSLRTGSSLGTKKHQQVNIFPNPVRPGYAGQVGISGLTTNASLKITDVNGKLIRHIDATGGTAAWDLLDYNQHEVNSGIYVIFSSSDDGEETYIGKIAVIR